jgi:glycosyltransferase involved in cell wall biosynthesis
MHSACLNPLSGSAPRRARVLHILSSLGKHATAQVRIVESILDGIDRNRFDVHVLALDGNGDLSARFGSRGVACHPLQWSSGLRDLRGTFAFLSFSRRNRFDVAHIHALSRALPWLVQLSGAKPILHLHGRIDESVSHSPVVRTPRGVAAVITTSKCVANTVQAKLVRTVYPAVTIPEVAVQRDRPNGVVVIGTAARLEPVKGLEFLLRAFARIRQNNPDTLLEIAGDGSQRDALESQARNLGIADSVRFLGWVSDVQSVMRRWHIFALASVEEGFGLAVLEAMALGLPVLATAVGGIPEIVTDDKDGLLIDPRNVDHLANGLERLINSPELCARLGQNARTKATDFSVARMAHEVESVYELVLRKSG